MFFTGKAATARSLLEQYANDTGSYGIKITAKDICLFDRGQNDPQIRTICLDVWDKLFMSNLQDVKPLSDMIDNFE